MEQKKIKFNRTAIYHRRERLSPKDELKLCDDVNVLSNKENLIKVVKKSIRCWKYIARYMNCHLSQICLLYFYCFSISDTDDVSYEMSMLHV